MEHPITPPQGLVNQWRIQAPVARDGGAIREQWIATQAARWGDDQRLEAIIHWLITGPYGASIAAAPGDLIHQLHAAMRPKPPSLKKQACDALDTYVYGNPNSQDKERTYNTIRRALERLAELEAQQDG